MALIVTSGFPRDMPERDDGVLPFENASFDPLYQQTKAPLRGGLVQVANIGTELWKISFKTHAMEYEDALDYAAWLHSLRGGARLFKAWHPLLAYPINYPDGFAGMTRAGGGAFDGTCTLTAIGGSRDTITLSTLPAAYVFKRGDMVSFPMGSSQTLHRVVASATADGTGDATLTVEPTIPLAATTSVTAVLVKPWCLAVLDAESVNGPFEPGQIGRVQFSAVQTF